MFALAAVFEGGGDLLLCSLVCIDQNKCLAAHLREYVLDHLAKFGELQVLIVANNSVEEGLQLNVIEALLDDEIESRLEEFLEILKMILVLELCLSLFDLDLLRHHGHILFSDSSEDAILSLPNFEHAFEDEEPCFVDIVKILVLF